MGSATESNDSVADPRRVADELATLVRLPNLFTAPPDVIAGAALAAATGAVVAPATVAGLCVASLCLYAAGTTLNDVADVAEDSRDRPGRPIPSGAIDRQGAAALGVGFLVTGVAVASVAGGVVSGLTAGALAVTVACYDFVLKGGPAGPLSMGTARGLNVALGLSVAGGRPFDPLVLAVPVAVGGYVAALTWMAEGETRDSDRTAVAVTAAAALIAGAAVSGVVGSLAGGRSLLLAALAAVVFVAWVGRALVPAYTDPTPGTVGPAVGAAVLGIVLLDAAVAAVAGPLVAAGTAAFVVPSVGLAGRFDVT
jgi:4-hydroxybenzoate polyprenyltransferase